MKAFKNHKISSTCIEYMVLILLFGVISFIFLLSSSLHPWISSEANIDSSVFKTVAMMMDKGYMPYRDSFDHKGPLLYILEWIGYKIAPYCGTWVIEFIFMVVFLFACYKLACLCTDKITAFVVSLTTVALLGNYYSGGDYTEEYALSFSAISLYIFIDFFLNDVISKSRLLILGFCFAATFLLRPNLIAVWPAFILIILIQTISKKDWSSLMNYILWFVLGIAIITIPIFLWLASNGCVQYCYDAFIRFNFTYSSSAGGRSSISDKLVVILTFLRQPLPLMSIISQALLLILQKERKLRLLNLAYIIYILINLVFTSMGGVTHEHYAIILVPMLVYPLSSLLENIWSKTTKTRAWIKITAYLILVSVFVFPAFKGNITSLPGTYRERHNTHFSELSLEVKDVICGLTDDDDTISVYGNFDFLYLICSRKHAGRYSFQFPISSIDPSILEEYYSQLEEANPKVIVVTEMYRDDKMNNFLTKHDYESVYSIDGLVSVYALY